MSPQAIFQQQQNTQLVASFLTAAHATPSVFMESIVDEQVKCWGFPEFNPHNRDEYIGFFNYLGDVFEQMDFRIEQCMADNSQALVRFCISGIHHEEFMGLPATGSQLTFSATALFRLENGMIKEVWMYNKHVSLKTSKGTTYRLQDRQAENCCIGKVAC
jgi:predicted ester cyclase